MKRAEAVLNELIKVNHFTNNMIYKVFHANHTTHLLCSLYSLGSDETKLRNAYENYKKVLEPLPKPTKEITKQNYKDYIGHKETYPGYVNFFDQIIKDIGIKDALREYFPQIINGLSSAALHPLINVGYGLEYKNDYILSEGLAYGYSWYGKRGDIIPSIEMKKDLSLKEIFQTCHDTSFHIVDGSRMLDTKLDNLVHHNAQLIKLLESWTINEDNIEAKYQELSEMIVEIYGGSYNQKNLDFFILHCLTGNHAIQFILPYLESKDQVNLLRTHLFSTLAIYVNAGQPRIDSSLITNVQIVDSLSCDWDSIFKVCIDTEASHLIKVVRNLKNLEERYGDRDGVFLKTVYLTAKNIKTEDDWNFRGIGYQN